MLWLGLFVSLVYVLNHQLVNSYTIDPCFHVQCPKPMVACLEFVPGTKGERNSYECRCQKECKRRSIIKTPIVRTLAPNFFNKPNENSRLEKIGKPIAKQGGSSCYPSACMNGGTCYSYNYNPTMPTTTTTTTTTTASPSYTPPICSCQPQFSGSRCELYNPTMSSIDGWNNLCRVYNDRGMNICQNGGQCVFVADGQVACVCSSSFTGQYCELPVYIQCAGYGQGGSYTLCHRDHGTCLSDGTCQCQPGYCGPKCDQRVSNTVTFNPTAQSSMTPPTTQRPIFSTSYYSPVTTSYPNPVTSGYYNPMTSSYYNPVTSSYYNPVTTAYSNPYFSPITSQSTTTAGTTLCLSYYCLNGGTCQPFSVDPYVICICPTGYTGTRCETCISQPQPQPQPGYNYNNYGGYGGSTMQPGVTTTVPTTTTTITTISSTIEPHCNFTIGLLNQGAYSTRFKVQYYIDGILQPVITSNVLPLIGQETSVTIPYYATNVTVALEKLGLSWTGIVSDTGFDMMNRCTKCYTVWGAVTNANWDYRQC